ncbi:putative folate metabolism gamma-glutamate ligase [Candidatus Beckwithbacteria bacterium CG10_big_fil_rev_8_21_14_0_10_34_10]|uniref:Putative folate metabolism gamma-glutamate ligase n=1 Tax=Candidatus Beckwithbacteria bacterium CG10_big_fil_rev_8_21_14_0_10_34_10 TaxID=1974495 RepID=A0A2H0WAN2_9BACT|nr:MAG: putative folate metabolism gamma-glutamate ligase [Candidatus Beckwithbacteria bacterium CG10_big_fil_rev_8_21_14_0_10_34_10]
MKVTAIKTPIVKKNDNLLDIIRDSIKTIPENSVLVITSKIISYCQGRIVKKALGGRNEKHSLVRQEADLYLEPSYSQYKMMLTIKNSTLAVNAGIDESNADDGYVLWPNRIQKTTNKIWRFLKKNYHLKKVGVIITDSKTIPLRWGVIGTAISHCGFKALYDYRGKEDLFGRKVKMSQANVVEGIAVSAVLEMGEVAEKNPLCLVQNIKRIKFQNRPPTKKELEDLKVSPKDDVFGPLLTSVDWVKRKAC